MNIYHIDFENVHNRGFIGLDALSVDDCIVIYYSKNALSIGIELVQRLMSGSFHTEFVKVVETWFPGEHKDAMDFYIVANVFAVNGTGINQYIVSNDTSFDCAITAGEQLGIKNISRIQKISDTVPVSDAMPAKKPSLDFSQNAKPNSPDTSAPPNSETFIGADDDSDELSFDSDYLEMVELNKLLRSANGGRTHESDLLDEMIASESMNFERNLQQAQAKPQNGDSNHENQYEDADSSLSDVSECAPNSSCFSKMPVCKGPIKNTILTSHRVEQLNLPPSAPTMPASPFCDSESLYSKETAAPLLPNAPQQNAITQYNQSSKPAGTSKKKSSKLSAQERKRLKKQKRNAALVSFRNILSKNGFDTNECNSISNYVVTILENNKNKPVVYIQNLILKNYGKHEGNTVVSLLKKEINKQRSNLAS